MRYLKSILIFLFVSSTLSAFYYALNRTNGNLGKSIMFTMYYLSIKLNLIGPNLVMTLDQHYPNQQQLVAKTRFLPFYHPYISSLDDYYYRPSRLYMIQTEMGAIVTQYSHSARAITQLRAGSHYDNVRQTASLFIVIWWMTRQCNGFQPINQPSLPPHLEVACNFLFGKSKSDQLFCQQASIFDPQEFEISSLYSLEILSQEDALAQITK